MSTEISFSEIKEHKDHNSLWIVIHNQVYDVTKFLAEHPGGQDALLEYGGKDGTQAFEDIGHSDDARELRKEFKIGVLPAEEKAKDVPIAWPPPPIVEPPPIESDGWGLKWALLALAAALIIGYSLKKYME